MRLPVLVVVGLLAVPALALAQGHADRPPRTQPPPAPPIALPSIGLTVPQIGVLYLPTGLPPLTDVPRHIVPFHDGEFPGHDAPPLQPHGKGRRPLAGAPVVFYMVPEYPFSSVAAAATPPEPVRPITGSLVMQVEPGTAQLFVDGYYAGVPEDFDGQHGELTLDLGPHKVELVAPGYENVSFDVKVAAGEPITYRTSMKPAATDPPPAPAPAVFISPQPMYHIPGCYLGNVPPSQAHLPLTCDQTRALTLAP